MHHEGALEQSCSLAPTITRIISKIERDVKLERETSLEKPSLALIMDFKIKVV
jgi:hypothetical protein